jgi:hypothetical protein
MKERKGAGVYTCASEGGAEEEDTVVLWAGFMYRGHDSHPYNLIFPRRNAARRTIRIDKLGWHIAVTMMPTKLHPGKAPNTCQGIPFWKEKACGDCFFLLLCAGSVRHFFRLVLLEASVDSHVQS